MLWILSAYSTVSTINMNFHAVILKLCIQLMTNYDCTVLTASMYLITTCGYS